MGDRGVSSYTANASQERDKLRMFAGQQNHYVADLSVTGGVDLEIPDAWKHCRYLEVDTDGIVKVDYTDDADNARTETKAIVKGYRWLVQNVTKVYYYYEGSNPLTTTVYRNDGTGPVLGVKLYY